MALHAAYQTLMGLLGVGTASAPETAAVAEHDRQDLGVTPAEQAANIAVAMIPVERILGLAAKAVGGAATTVIGSLSTQECRVALRRLMINRIGGARLPGTVLPPGDLGKLALIDIAAAERPIVIRHLSVESVDALTRQYGSGLAVGLNQKGTIAPYNALARAVEGLDRAYQAHHIVEVQVLEKLGLPTDQAPAVILTSAEHTQMTTALARELPPGHLDAMSKQEILRAYETVYRDRPEWIAEVRRYFTR